MSIYRDIFNNMYKEHYTNLARCFSLRNKNRRRENHSGRTTCFRALSGDHDVLFRGRFRRDATRRKENASPKKSIILPVSGARTRIGAGDLFSDDRGVPGATFTRGLSCGSERSARGLIISYFV